ncbi:hypothetical protein JCM11491_002397 [Sporobolomyces phaffii]
MPLTTRDYDARARAPLLASADRRRGPGIEPVALTAYEPGKRHRRRAPSETTSDEDEDDDDPPPRARDAVPRRPTPTNASSRVNLYLIVGILAVVVVGAAAYLYRSHATFFGSESGSGSGSGSGQSLVATSRSVDSSSSSEPAATEDRPDSAAAASTNPLASRPDSPSASATPTSTPTPTSTRAAAGDDGAPLGYSGITLSGTFVDSGSYAVATGRAGYVGDAKANADMSRISVEPNDELVEPADRPGKIWIGDVTFYAAGKGGYGSCGTKLYDGQELYFAAMSTYDLMGSASPSPFCYSYISLQSTVDPSKTITAIVADSCPACTLAHVDLEQSAYFALGATVEMGVLTVAW